MKLNQIANNPGAHKHKHKVGRGSSSGLGKTSGRGVKGAKARTGNGIYGFEGGQMPLHMRMPKRGFNVPNVKRYNAVRIDRVQQYIDSGKLDHKGVIDAKALIAGGLIRRPLDGVRLIGSGEFKTKKVTFNVYHASKGAIAAIEAAGGKVDILGVKPAAVKNVKTSKKAKSGK